MRAQVPKNKRGPRLPASPLKSGWTLNQTAIGRAVAAWVACAG